ncbi:MAG TPA: hypothetical protein VKW08_07305 [Xanthobacteraceae bacterium]|jgi:hypothetical protein|nr:hypothetical protein [Xanthobacteraceae bacterium]
MAAARREDIIALLGPVDDVVVAEIIEMGATTEDLTEAYAWVTNNEALMNIGKPLAQGRTSRLVDLITALRESEVDEPSDR